MIERIEYINKIKELLKDTPVVALIGPRQVGKTTLAKMVAQDFHEKTFFDLENPTTLARLEDPMLSLQDLRGLVIIDEIQHLPELFKIIRILADRKDMPCRFLVLGSASPALLRQSPESLAGRIAYLEVHGFSLAEVGISHLEELWLRGSFPRSFLASTTNASVNWRREFIRTFLERDLPQLGIEIPAITMRRFWMMLAHYHGQIWNGSEFARAFGMSDSTIRRYLDILTATFIVKQIPPWWENISKRQVKSPKVYINDSGLLHTLFGLNNKEELANHPKIGASWEGFALNAVMNQLNVQPEEVFFWGTHSGAELDLLIMRGNIRLGFEFKRTVAPKITKSLRIAMQDLNLSQGYIVHAGNETFPLAANITALSITQILQKLHPLT
ncbi:hypothetical protein AYO45_02495 [Gammaproteobacteria bacterium SCGC AG-212-F23]|nr:hypothetical protein AYO45_02495 [Gammaproteobacteria bacterium SCGC AG-212-F23]